MTVKIQETLIQNADLAMYQAKIQGKNQYVFCTEEMKENNLTTQKLSADLSIALAREEFILHTISLKLIF